METVPLYALTFNDDYTGYYGFSLSENGGKYVHWTSTRGTLRNPRESHFPDMKAVAVVDNAELTASSCSRLLRPALLDNLTEAERSVVDEFLHWAQALRAEDILNLRFPRRQRLALSSSMRS